MKILLYTMLFLVLILREMTGQCVYIAHLFSCTQTPALVDTHIHRPILLNEKEPLLL